MKMKRLTWLNMQNKAKKKYCTLKFATLLFNNLMPFGQKQSISIETCT